MNSYDYAHRSGVQRLSWDDFASLSRCLAEMLEPQHPHVILGIARAGLFPATAVACALRCELFPIRLTRRVADQVVYASPIWKVPIPADVKGKIVAVIDEIADTGQTLVMARHEALTLGAERVFTVCLVNHSWANPVPDITALVSDEFVIFPWDAQVLDHGKWVVHPEIELGIKAQSR
ncbi:MAG: hypothetical protein C3F13_00825 [Anaerolineales bacterium]|nr:phosphoribosyltransferase [Anaerolineae bacterium]PWB56647.1 MAG: hypothetical protein C3F13_00825 [Anaerolineales bacterium]